MVVPSNGFLNALLDSGIHFQRITPGEGRSGCTQMEHTSEFPLIFTSQPLMHEITLRQNTPFLPHYIPSENTYFVSLIYAPATLLPTYTQNNSTTEYDTIWYGCPTPQRDKVETRGDQIPKEEETDNLFSKESRA